MTIPVFNNNVYRNLDEADEIKFREPQKALVISHRAYVMSIKTADKRAEAYSLYVMGVCYELLSDYPEAMKHLSESIKISAQIGDRRKLADALNTIGIINDNLGNYANALKTYFRALKLYEELQELSAKAIVLSNIGLVYTRISDYVNALKFYSAASEMALKLNDEESLLVTYINIGLTHRLLKEFAKAEEYLLKAKTIAEKNNDHLRQSIVLIELGDVQVCHGNYSKGYEYYAKSLELKKKLDDKKGISSILGVMGELYLKEGKLTEAKESFLASLELSESLGVKQRSSEIHKFLSWIYENEKNYEPALKHYRAAHGLELEHMTEESDLRAKNLAIQHEVEDAQKEAEIQRLRNVELAKALEDVKKLNDNLQDLNQEKNEFMAVAVHDLKNPLQNILSTARVLKNTKDADAEIINEFTANIISQTDRMFNLIKKLLDHNAIEQGNIKIRKSIFRADSLCAEVIANHTENAERKSIGIVFEDNSRGASVHTDYDILFQILDNLLSNALKFSPSKKHVYFNCRLDNNKVVFEISDEGPGFSEADKQKMFSKFARLSAKPTGEEHSTGLGLSIVKKLTEIIGANIHFENNPNGGAKFTLKIVDPNH